MELIARLLPILRFMSKILINWSPTTTRRCLSSLSLPMLSLWTHDGATHQLNGGVSPLLSWSTSYRTNDNFVSTQSSISPEPAPNVQVVRARRRWMESLRRCGSTPTHRKISSLFHPRLQAIQGHYQKKRKVTPPPLPRRRTSSPWQSQIQWPRSPQLFTWAWNKDTVSVRFFPINNPSVDRATSANPGRNQHQANNDREPWVWGDNFQD
jgi:hypothetical protein